MIRFVKNRLGPTRQLSSFETTKRETVYLELQEKKKLCISVDRERERESGFYNLIIIKYPKLNQNNSFI